MRDTNTVTMLEKYSTKSILLACNFPFYLSYSMLGYNSKTLLMISVEFVPWMTVKVQQTNIIASERS